jgi:hypothetical protein
MTDLINYYLNLRDRSLINTDECCNAIQKEIEARKQRREKALAQIDLELKQKQHQAKAKIQARLLQLQEELRRVEQIYQHLFEQENTVAQTEPLENESFPQPVILQDEQVLTEEPSEITNEEEEHTESEEGWRRPQSPQITEDEHNEPQELLVETWELERVPPFLRQTGESSRSIRNTWPPLNRRQLVTIKDYYKKYKGVPVESMPNLPCGCEPKILKREYGRHNTAFNPTLQQPLHCCKCYRPGNKQHIAIGNDRYYQWCTKCERNESYDVTRESWYNTPCRICQNPMTEKVNVAWNMDVCSTECKYAYLSTSTANGFTHIPTKIKHYIETKGCRDQYLNVAAIAESYYRRTHPHEILDYTGTQYHNQLSWTQMAREFSRDLNREWNNRDFEAPYSTISEAEALRQSFETHERPLTQRFTDLRDLNRDGRLGDKIRLCDECFLPYTTDELKEANGRWLCTKTETNPNPCEEDNSLEQGLSTTSTQPIQIPERPPNHASDDPWEQ